MTKLSYTSTDNITIMFRRHNSASRAADNNRAKLNSHHSEPPFTEYYELPKKKADTVFSIKAYMPPEGETGGYKTLEDISPPKKKLSLPLLRRRNSRRRRQQHDAPSSPSRREDSNKDYRTQTGYIKGKRDLPEKRAASRSTNIPWPSSSEIVAELEKVILSANDEDSSLIGSDQSDNELDDRRDHTRKLMKQNRQMKRAFQSTVKFLECERAQNIALQERMDLLSKQVDQLQKATKVKNPTHNESTKIEVPLNSHGQLVACRKELQEEKVKSIQFRQQADALKRENIKFKEKMKVLMFQHIPNSSMKFQDIGPCDVKIAESQGLIADYELGTELGEGHFGKVCVGTNVSNKNKFAIKVLNKARINRFKDLQQVMMEVHVLTKYQHQNIVRLQEVIHAPQNLYLVTELCSMDLHKYHSEIGMSEIGAKHVTFGILKPLYHLHSNGICHLDLKPENILIAANADVNNITHYDVRLCDFGLVNMAKSPERSKEILRKGYACGTPGFFAPEMIIENAFEGRQADIWSLGCILLEITLGFTREWVESYDRVGDSKGAALFRQGLEVCLDEIAPQHYPRHKQLLDIIHSCLSMDPMRRISSKEAMIHPWLEEAIMSDSNKEGRQDVSASFFQ